MGKEGRINYGFCGWFQGEGKAEEVAESRQSQGDPDLVQEFSLCLWIKVSPSHQPPEQEMPQQQVPLTCLLQFIFFPCVRD